ncbi:MAG: site-specific integrase [Solirubrobacterales bacterium]
MSAVDTSPSSERAGIEPLIIDFLAYLELERGLSRNTLEAYRCDLLQFGAFLDRRAIDARQAEHGDLAAFLSELSGAPDSTETGGRGPGGPPRRPAAAAATLGRKVACLRSFYRHLRREGAIEHDPTAELRGPRKSQRLPRVLSRAEVARLLREPKGTEPLALRDRALLELMYACGLRVSEAIGLDVGDVDLDEGMLRARGNTIEEGTSEIQRSIIAERLLGMPKGY